MSVVQVQVGQTVGVHYVGTFDDGTQFDNSHTRGEPMNIEVGAGQVIPGFDNAIVGMSVGETKNVSLSPDEGYGQLNSSAIQEVPKTAFPPDFPLQEGMQVQGEGPAGPLVATVQSYDNEIVVLDMNHPLAGKNLNFAIELISIS